MSKFAVKRRFARGRRREAYLAMVVLLFWAAGCLQAGTPALSAEQRRAERQARAVIKACQGVLAPVYAPLAEQIVVDFDLAEKEGIGIDIGSGPGNLIIELCARTKMHWINADINPHFFPYFFAQAAKRGFGYRVSAILADAQALPFRDNYADIIVSRGSFHFWKDKVRAFGEIYRVLKPGAVAYIGRGFPRNLPVETAGKIRVRQGTTVRYDVEKTATELRGIMNVLGIKDYRIHRPKPPGSGGVNYGIWLEFRKPGPG